MVRPVGWFVLSAVVAGTAPASRCSPASAERYEPRSFLGYACDDDCERHKAGFAWAESHAVAGVAACASLERAESEGCRVFVEEPVAAEQAGFRWALENEIQVGCWCAGAGERFRNGCLRALSMPTDALD